MLLAENWITELKMKRMKAFELVRPFEEMAPLSLQEKWDNCGFSVGDPQKEISRVLVALDCTEEVMDEAVSCGADMIITHHPLIFSGIKKISPQNWLGRVIYKAINHGIVIYSAHTNMDKAAGGVSSLMAQKLGMEECIPLTPDNFGIVGNLPQECFVEELAAKVKEVFGIDTIRCSEPLQGKVSRIAVCGGSGKQFIADAMQQGAQVYITGDITYHDFYTEKGFMVMDIGHYFSEYGIVGLFANIVSENFPNFAVSMSKKSNNPIYYY